MKEDQKQTGDRYEITIKGHLDKQWSSWFEEWEIIHKENGTTILTACNVDQPALHGILVKLLNLNLKLLSINHVDPGQLDIEESI